MAGDDSGNELPQVGETMVRGERGSIVDLSSERLSAAGDVWENIRGLGDPVADYVRVGWVITPGEDPLVENRQIPGLAYAFVGDGFGEQGPAISKWLAESLVEVMSEDNNFMWWRLTGRDPISGQQRNLGDMARRWVTEMRNRLQKVSDFMMGVGKKRDKVDEGNGSGSTMACLIMDRVNDVALLMQTGDSPIYGIKRDGLEAEQLTSEVSEGENGIADAFLVNPTSAKGIFVKVLKLSDYDGFVLASDGLHEERDAETSEVVKVNGRKEMVGRVWRESGSLEEKVNVLMDEIRAGGGTDDLAVLMVANDVGEKLVE